MIYYNDNDSFVIKWLGSLTESGHIEKGVIDDRSIKDVKPEDLKGKGVSMKDLRGNLINDFKDKDYRHGYVDEFLNASIATQIKVLREQRGWNQKELAQRTEMKQPRISVIENVNYASWNISTLRRIAEAFDLTLKVSFESFGNRLNDILKFGRENLERESFEVDPLIYKAYVS